MANRKGHGANGFTRESRKGQAERLTVMQQRFVDEYLIDTDATNAAIRAGYSEASASQIAHQLLQKEKVREQVAEAIQRRSDDTGIDARFILTHLAAMLHADFGDIVNEDGSYKPIHAWPKIWRQMLTGLDTEEIWQPVNEADAKGLKLKHKPQPRELVGRVLKAKFIDRMRAIELAGRHVDVRAFQAEQAPASVNVHLHAMNEKQMAERVEALTEKIRQQLNAQAQLERPNRTPRVLEGTVVRDTPSDQR